ncbi:MAG: gliding motility-associated C-terminal domain-containing protein [Microscillaceae bacterium]|nr:gliding motility-associated C-terminal domain-containing protein [Microscillaceae bacterium]
MKKKPLLLFFLIFFLKAGYTLYAQDVGLIINEIKSGSDADTITIRREFIELLVVGCPGKGAYTGNTPDNIGPDPTTVDIRGWIIDDDNGEFSAVGAPSVTQGHIRFANNPNWQAVPVGSIILIYNTAAYRDPVTNIVTPPASDDPTDIGGDKIYVLGIDAKDDNGAPLMQFCPDLPSAANQNYNPLVCVYDTARIDSWRYIEMRNAGDGIQIRKDSTANFFHGISYGIAADPVNGGAHLARSIGTRSVHFANTDGANRDFIFANPGAGPRNDNYRDLAAYTSSTGSGTPGRSNNTRNGAYISQFISTDAGPEKFVCGLTTTLQASGVKAIWTDTEMWNLNDGSGVWTVESTPVPLADVSFGSFTLSTSSVSVDVSGTYVFRWTQTPADNICIDSDIVPVTFIENPAADAGTDLVVCGSDTTLNAIPGVLGEWEFIPRRDSLGNPIQSGVTLVDPNDPQTAINVIEEGIYTFRWKVGIEGVTGCFDTDDVKVQFVFNDFVFSAGNDQSVCGLNTRFAGSGPGVWSLISTSPGGLPTPTIQDDTDPRSQVTVSQAGTYTFKWLVGEGQICEDSDTVRIKFTQQPVANAGKDSTFCGLNYTLAGNAPQTQTVGQWSQVSGPGTITFNNNSLQNTGIQASVEGLYRLRWSISGVDSTICVAQDDVSLNFIAQPTPSAGPDTLICGLSFSAQGSAPQDALTTGLWTSVPGNPGTPVFGNATAFNTPIAVDNFGDYQFVWTLTRTKDGRSCPVSDTVLVTFVDIPGSGLSNLAGRDTSICGFEIDLNAQLPVGTPPITGAWVYASGISPTGTTVNFDDITNPNTRIRVDTSTAVTGDYFFIWTLSQQQSGPVCTNTDTVRVNFVAFPKPNAGKDSTICDASLTYTLQGNAIPAGGGGEWRLVSGPGTASFAGNDNTKANSQVTVTAEGVYEFEWLLRTLPDSCERTDLVQLTFVVPPVPIAEPDTSGICDQVIQVNGNLPAGTTGVWAQISGPGTATFGSNTDPSTSVTINQVGNYAFIWTLTKEFNGVQVCPVSDTIQVQFINNPIPNAGPDVLDYCFPSSPSAPLAASPSSGPVGNGIWSTLTPGANFSDPTNPTTSVTVSAPGTYDLVWTIEPGTTCEVSDTVSLTFTNPLTASVASLPDSICGLSSTLRATSGFPVGQWTANPAGGVVFSDPTLPTTSVTVPATGGYTFTWAEGQAICRSTATTNAVYFSEPLDDPSLNPSPEVIIFEGKSTVLTASGGAEYLWSPTTGLSDPTSPNPTANPLETTTYSVRIKSGFCDTTLSVTVRVIIELLVPNVFTPNGDGRFDTWTIQALPGFDDASVEVFDRWGDRVFESKGYSTPWDGTNKNNGKPVPTSTYYYVIKLNNEQPPYTGYVTVTR